MSKLPISAVVVSLNEGHILKPCLRALSFCDEVVLIDLESDDESATIGRNCGARVISRPRAEYVEVNQCWIVDKVKHDWILYIDPDEIIDDTLAVDIGNLLPSISEDICQVFLPWQFYYMNKPLKGTIWGGEKHKGVLVNRNRIIVQAKSQHKFNHSNNYKQIKIPHKDRNVIHHYWLRDRDGFMEKHRRYIRIEKNMRYNNGWRFCFKQLLTKPFNAFTESYIKCGGYKDGYIGLMLSLFWSWYNFMGVYSLLNYEPNAED